MPDVEAIVAALEEEKQGYVKRGLDDRAEQVDAEIARLKKTARQSSAPAETATVAAPETTSASTRRTTRG